MGNYKAFKIISDAFYGYYSLLQECRKCDKFCSNKLHYYIIKDVISVSFIIEIGFKALLAYEGKKADCTHNLIDLFELLSTEKHELKKINNKRKDYHHAYHFGTSTERKKSPHRRNQQIVGSRPASEQLLGKPNTQYQCPRNNGNHPLLHPKAD